jgi:hypothetical protein
VTKKFWKLKKEFLKQKAQNIGVVLLFLHVLYDYYVEIGHKSNFERKFLRKSKFGASSLIGRHLIG